MVTRVQKWGNSLGLRLPKEAAAEANIGEGTPVEVRVENGVLTVRAAELTQVRLKDLLGDIRRDNLHEAIDFGAPVGREAP